MDMPSNDCFECYTEDRMRRLSEHLTHVPPRKYLDATEALMKWLTEAEEILLENVYITDITTMEKNITLYQVIQMYENVQ